MVTIDVEQNCISVYNNGDGVPVEIHQEEGVYVPEMIFGHLLTSSNYDDLMKKMTGGRNGYGAKLTNIVSTEFVIETADGKRQKKYKQVFSNNMGKKSEPIITKCKESENWTKVTFKPDLAKFNMTRLEDDVVALMKKRVIDLAGCLGKTVKVELWIFNKMDDNVEGTIVKPAEQFLSPCSSFLHVYMDKKGSSLMQVDQCLSSKNLLMSTTYQGKMKPLKYKRPFTFLNFYIYDDFQRILTRKILSEKITQLNSAIDDVSSQLRADDTPNGTAVSLDELEASI
ncbi:DNA topoisomerase 2 [Camellia lanceoleosa]|uniref:DNA topoisomerase 2 n=1 Tax=Camellia lanceoleosa TaxID=1840588 RepID=A0ACC0FXD2_9ERIC|nr:DNA topoisomerase 2 [Camellia lanceoleosa]